MKKKGIYFDRLPGSPAPLTESVSRYLRFSEADPMQISWHGNVPGFFEDAHIHLVKKCSLYIEDFRKEGLYAPIVQFHADYHSPIHVDEKFVVTARLIWTDLPRMNMEYEIKTEEGKIAVTGYTVQLFIVKETGETCWYNPEVWEACRTRWKNGMIL